MFLLLERLLPKALDRLTYEGAWMLALRTVLLALEFACGVALARTFGAYAYGVYALSIAWVTVLGVPAALGFDRLLIRELSILRTQRVWDRARALIRYSSVRVLAAAAGLAAVVAACAPAVTQDDGGVVSEALRLAMLIVPIAAYARLRQAALQGFGRAVAGYVPEAVVQPLTLLVLVIAWRVAAGPSGQGATAVLLHICSSLVAMIAGVLIFRALTPREYRVAPRASADPAWLRRALPFMWMLGMNVVMTTIDTLILGLIVGPPAAGVYRVVSQISMLVLLPASTLSVVMASEIAALHSRGLNAELEAKAAAAAGLSLAGALAVCIGLFALGIPALRVFGPQFVEGYPAMQALSVAYLLSSVAGVSGYLLIMTRYEVAVATIATVGACVNIGLNLLLIPRMGMLGAGIATGASTLLVSASYAIVTYSKLRIRPKLL